METTKQLLRSKQEKLPVTLVSDQEQVSNDVNQRSYGGVLWMVT